MTRDELSALKLLRKRSQNPDESRLNGLREWHAHATPEQRAAAVRMRAEMRTWTTEERAIYAKRRATERKHKISVTPEQVYKRSIEVLASLTPAQRSARARKAYAASHAIAEKVSTVMLGWKSK